ncbi:MAG: hypothetical protein O3A46_12890, partial [Candidatus Poribacteria bacterium]|nr:hypothetical protein [Candidatus Poribacteria bacterium]
MTNGFQSTVTSPLKASDDRSGVTWRVLLFGIPLVVLVSAIVSYAELVVMYIQIGFLQFPPVVVGVLFFLVVGNKVFTRIGARWGLSRQEIMLIYAMLLMSSMVSSRGLMEKLIPALVAVNYFANEGNTWREIFFHHIRPELVPFDPSGIFNQDVARLFYEKVDDPALIPWGVWVRPLAVWGVLAGFVYGAFLCLAALLRRQWVDHE